MSVASEITALEGYLTNAYDKVNAKGGTLPQNKNMQNLTNAIDSIPTSSIIIIPPDAGTLTSISVTSAPTKTTYTEGEYFDFTGLVITATYSSGQQFDVTNSCTYVMNQPLQVSDTSILVTYESQTTTISIVVNAIPVPAPVSTTALFHFDNNMNNECGGSADIPSYSITYVTGKFGMSAQPSGAYIKMNCPSISNSNLRSQPLTFECWLKFTGSLGYDSFYYRNTYSDSTFDRFFTSDTITSTGLKVRTSGTRPFASTCVVDNIPSSFDKTQWNHVAVCCLGDGTYKVYLNGTLACHGNITSTSDVGFRGASTYTSSSGNYGQIDEYLQCDYIKYNTDFVPNHAPYYLQSNS